MLIPSHIRDRKYKNFSDSRLWYTTTFRKHPSPPPLPPPLPPPPLIMMEHALHYIWYFKCIFCQIQNFWYFFYCYFTKVKDVKYFSKSVWKVFLIIWKFPECLETFQCPKSFKSVLKLFQIVRIFLKLCPETFQSVRKVFRITVFW